MHIRMPKPTKAEFIMMFLNQWDPAHGADKDYKFYQADAEEIAQLGACHHEQSVNFCLNG